MKKYRIKQTVPMADGVKTSSFEVQMDEADLGTFLATLEGGITVYEANASLGVPTPTSNVASTNPITKLSFSAKDVDGDSIFATIRPYSGVIHLKNTVDSNKLVTDLGAIKPFKNSPTVVPSRISAQFTESV